MRRVMRIYGGKASRKVIRPTNLPYDSMVAKSTNFATNDGDDQQ